MARILKPRHITRFIKDSKKKIKLGTVTGSDDPEMNALKSELAPQQVTWANGWPSFVCVCWGEEVVSQSRVQERIRRG